MYKNQLHFYTITTIIKKEKNPIYDSIKKNKINQDGKRSVY